MYPKPAVTTMQTATSPNREVVRRFRQSIPITFEEDTTNGFDGTYASARITPLNPICRKRSHIFPVGLCVTEIEISAQIRAPCRQRVRIVYGTGSAPVQRRLLRT